MTTWYREGGTHKWHKVPDDKIVRDFAMEYLLKKAGQDSDNGYHEYLEIFEEGGKRWFAYADYDSYYGECEGEMNLFDTGDLEYMKKQGYYVSSYAFGPDHDWLFVNSLTFPVGRLIGNV